MAADDVPLTDPEVVQRSSPAVRGPESARAQSPAQPRPRRVLVRRAATRDQA